MPKPLPPPRHPAVEAVIERLESLHRAGVTHLPRCPSRPAASGLPAGKTPVAESPSPVREQSSAVKVEARSQIEALDEVASVVAQCTRCAELARTRTQTVFGAGNPSARLVFCGEAPGADEDRQGVPFVGAAGHLLNKILAACTLRREDVYLLNILRCRPPGNRTPAPNEAANCREYLDAQLSIIQPEFICCLGACAAQSLLGTTQALGKLRGRFHDYRGIRVLCTYHPAYLLRNPTAKRPTWEDMQILMAAMGIVIPKKD